MSALETYSCPIPKHLDQRTKSPFELVHTDVWGPSRFESTLRFWYFVTFIDDYSRCTWVFLMKTRRCEFAVESKSFEFTMEGKGKKAKCFITERSRGVASWVRFGIEGMEKLLMGVEECCRVFVPASRTFAWRENGRSFRLESKENNAGRFLLCFVTDGEGKKHWLVFSEGRGFLNGWTMLAEKIRGLGFKPRQENIPMRIATVDPPKGGREVYKPQKEYSHMWGKVRSKGCG